MDELMVMVASEAREITNRIKSNLTSARVLLLEMYERKGWEALGYESWREYGQVEFGYSESRIYQLMDAAKVERNISTMVEKPIPERQLRPLTKLQPDEQIEVYQEALDTAPGGKITAAHVQQVVNLRTADVIRIQARSNNEWYTPARYIHSAREVMGSIDLDPASNFDVNNRTINATKFYSIEDDGLIQNWFGNVWINPPYGGLAKPFVAKLIDEYTSGNVNQAILLVTSNATDTIWFASLWEYIICFTDHRINFRSPNNNGDSSTHGSAFIYLGPHENRFAKVFSKHGAVVKRYEYS